MEEENRSFINKASTSAAPYPVEDDDMDEDEDLDEEMILVICKPLLSLFSIVIKMSLSWLCFNNNLMSFDLIGMQFRSLETTSYLKEAHRTTIC